MRREGGRGDGRGREDERGRSKVEKLKERKGGGTKYKWA